MRVTPARRIDIGFQRRRGAGQHDRAILDACAHHRHVAGVIDGAVFLLVGLLMLFIDDDEAELAKGRNSDERAPTTTRASPDITAR